MQLSNLSSGCLGTVLGGTLSDILGLEIRHVGRFTGALFSPSQMAV